MSLSDEDRDEVTWWINNISHTYKRILTPKINITIYTDASKLGWGITDNINPSVGTDEQ